MTSFSFGQRSQSDSLISTSLTFPKSKNLLYAQVFGDYYIFGLNYERYYLEGKAFHLSGRLSLGQIGKRFGILTGNNFLFGKRQFLLEVGINPGLIFDREMHMFILSANLGIRYQNISKSPLFIRLSVSPILIAPEETPSIPVGVGLGLGF